MRLLRYFPVIFLFTTSLSQAQTRNGIDVLHYSYFINVSDSNDYIKGQAEISFAALDTTSFISIDLAGLDKDNKGMVVESVEQHVSQKFRDTSSYTLPYQHTNGVLWIGLKSLLKKGDSSFVTIRYRGIPADGLIISTNKFGHRTFFSDNWPNRAHNWIPCVDDPADKAAVDFYVFAPSHYKVISNGIEKAVHAMPGNKKMSHWEETVPLPTKVMVVGIADFAVDQNDTVYGIPVSSWVFPENKSDGFRDYKPAASILSFFIDYIGPYGYKKLANVQSKTIFGGMENANAIFYFENSVDGRQDQESLIAHEIAHQWFGNMATEKSFTHLWLSEGFATYMAIIYNEKKYGADKARSLREEDRQQVIAFIKKNNHPVVDSLLPYMQLLNANSYQKGGWILHMLRHQLGDSVFHKCIQAYYAAYAGKNADTRDLQHVFENVSGQTLDNFFQQWLYTPGIPKLDISWNYSEKDKKINVSVTQLQNIPFNFPLELLIQNSKESKTETIRITGARQAFSIPVDSKPALVKPDPGVNLLFEN